MHRFFQAHLGVTDTEIVLEAAEAHHALQVLRLRPGDRLQVLNGAGCIADCAVTTVNKRSMQLAVVGRTMVPPLPWQITLGQAVPKGKCMDAVVQKATELGVGRIIPLLTERTAVHLESSGQIASKVEKWRTVAIESIKQCGSPWLPEIEVPVVLKEFLAGSDPGDLKFLGALGSEGRHLRHYWEEYWGQHRQAPRRMMFLIGPEGDFTPGELDQMKAAGCKPVSFGSWVLRCETAAIYAISILNHELRFARG